MGWQIPGFSPFLIVLLFHGVFNISDNISSNNMIISLSLVGKDAEGNDRYLISGTNSAFTWRDLGKNNFSRDGQLHVVHAPRVDDHWHSITILINSLAYLIYLENH
jgi:hypothetical protein